MEIKNNVVSLFEYKLSKQKIRDEEKESLRYALFIQQHSDDDTLDDINEFELTPSLDD